jgi:hypothetical protein
MRMASMLCSSNTAACLPSKQHTECDRTFLGLDGLTFEMLQSKLVVLYTHVVTRMTLSVLISIILAVLNIVVCVCLRKSRTGTMDCQRAFGLADDVIN